MGNTNKLIKGLGSGDLSWQDDFRLTDDNQIDDLFKVELDNGNVTINGTLTVQGVPITGSGSGLPSGAAGGDLSGTYPNPVVEKTRALKSATTVVDVSAATAPTAGQVLVANSGTDATWQVPPAANGLKSASSTVSVSAATAPTSGQVLTATSSSAATWQNAAGGAPSGAAGGDLSGTYPNPTVATVGGSTASAVNTGTIRANGASNLNNPNALVKRDVNGDFIAGLITAAGFVGNASSASAVKSATTTVNVSSATAPSSGQVLTATSSTSATWQTPGTAASAPAGSNAEVQFNDGGNTLTLGGALIASNTVSVKVDGTTCSALFATDSNTTYRALATAIAARPNVAAATVRYVAGSGSDERIMDVSSNNGTSIALTLPTVTGGATQTTLSIGSGVTAGDPNFMFGKENSTLLVGTKGRTQIFPSSQGAANPVVKGVFASETGAAGVILESAGGSGCIITGTAARGTRTTPTATSSGDSLLSITAGGCDGTSEINTGGRIDFKAAQTWTPAHRGTNISISTTPLGSTSTSENVQFIHGGSTIFSADGGTGNVGIGTTGDTTPTFRLDVAGGGINVEDNPGAGYNIGGVAGFDGSAVVMASPSGTVTITVHRGIITDIS